MVQGSCLCGDVRFSIELPVRFNVHCHCGMCRRAHGAAFVTWVGVPDAQFSLLAGELGRYASSPGAERSFCSRCGSPMFFRSERWPNEVHVALACIDGDVGVAPKAHVFFDDRCAFFEVRDELPRYGGPSGTEPL